MKRKKQTQTKKAPSQKHIFFLGMLLFSAGIIGLINDLWTTYTKSIEDLLPANTTFFIEGNTQKIAALGKENIEITTAFPSFQKYGEQIDLTDAETWIGSKVSFGKIKDEPFFAFKYRSKKKTKAFLQKTFLLPDESFSQEKTPFGTIYSPEFSGIFSFAFVNNWIILTEKKTPLMAILGSEKKLSSIQTFPKEGLFSKTIGKGYFTGDIFAQTDESTPHSGFVQTFKSLIHSGKFILAEETDGIDTSFEFTTTLSEIPSSGKTVLPELAQFSDENAFVFLNGLDLYQTYVRTKTFLETLHPELAIVFDGILEAESQEIFGPKFDFKTDFLSKMNGQYAVIIDFDDLADPFLKTTIISGFGKSDSTKTLNEFHESLRFAQGKFSTEIQTVELPNGKTRDEIIATDPKEIVIKKYEAPKGEFYSSLNPDSNTEISYGFLENYFVFSTHRSAVEKIFSGIFSPLSQNTAFRNQVLLKESPSESYGSLNTNKLAITSSRFSPENVQTLITQISESFPTVLFSRKIEPQKISWDFFFSKKRP